MLAPGIVSLWVLLVSCSPPSRPVLSEVLYDAVGDDSGLEFVELYNPTSASIPLSGLRLEAGDGSNPGRWTLRWTGSARDSIAALGRYLIGGSRLQPPPQSVVELSLQNGPDAVRLVWPDGATEVLGYGAHEFSEYVCGAGAPDVPSGQSLARVPDDADQGSNALDFRAATPSPGRPNLPSRDIAWDPGSLALTPEQPSAGSPARLTGRLINRGRFAIAAGDVRLIGETGATSGTQELFDVPIATALAAQESLRIEVPLERLVDGKQTLRVRAVLAGDEARENDLDTLRVRVGRGPLEVTEIQFHPTHQEGEWVEIRNRSLTPVAPDSFTLSDRGLARGHPTLGAGLCEPDSLVLFAQDREALLARTPSLDPRRVWKVAPWASLNNSSDSAGVADVVVVRESDGTPCERVAYSGSGVPNGTPIERHALDFWEPSLDPDGSPLAPPRALPPLAGHIAVEPRRLSASAGTARLSWSLPWARARGAIDLYDLSGTRIALVMPEATVNARGTRVWSLQGISPGLYLLALRARAESGGASLGATTMLRVDGVAP